MVGTLASVIGAPARTSAPSVPAVAITSNIGVARVGNNAPASGEKLPSAPPPEPVVDVERAVAQLNALMSGKQRSLVFEVDLSSGRTVITVINPATKEVIRQIPPEELLSLQRSLDKLGSLIDARV